MHLCSKDIYCDYSSLYRKKNTVRKEIVKYIQMPNYVNLFTTGKYSHETKCRSTYVHEYIKQASKYSLDA